MCGKKMVVKNVEINVQIFDDQCINDKLDEMMTDVEPNFEINFNTNSDDNAANLDSSSDVREEVVVENVEINVQIFDDQCINDKLDEMMTDVEPNFADTPRLFETLIMEKDIPLFPGCINYSKMTATFKLYNLKAKNGWSDKSFDSLLNLL
jgi:hypothetical protein